MTKTPKKLTRSYRFDRAAADQSGRTIELSVSSDSDSVRQYVSGIGYVREILGHEPNEVDLSRFQGPIGGPLLFNHDFSDLIGRFTATGLDGGKLRGVARFGNSPRAEALWRDLCDGILADVSVTYDYDCRDIEVTETDGEGRPAAIRVTRWAPLEVSFVTVPADASVGIGRSWRAEDDDEEDRESDEESPKKEDEEDREGDEDEEEDRESDEEKEEEGEEARSRPACKPRPPTTSTRTARPGRKDTSMQHAASPPDRVASILALADQFHVEPEKRNHWLQSGASVQAIQKEILEGFRQSAKPLPAMSDQLGLSKTERSKYSVATAVRYLVTQDSSIGGLEREVSAAMAKRLGRHQTNGGLLIPTDMQMRDTQATKRPDLGGNLVFKEYMGYLESLKNAAVVLQMGASLVSGLQGNPTWVRQESGSQFFWMDEAPGADVAEAGFRFGILTSSPKTAKSLISYTRQQVLQSVETFEPLLQKDLLENDALVVDTAALSGTGTDFQPLGLLNTPGIGALGLGPNGAKPTYADITKLKTIVKKANALGLGAGGYLTTPEIQDLLENTPKLSNTIAQAVWENDSMAGYRAIGSNQVPGMLTKGSTFFNCHALIFGVWSELFVLEWGALEMVVDPYTKAAQDVVRVTTSHLVDIFVRRPMAFAAIKDALPS